MKPSIILEMVRVSSHTLLNLLFTNSLSDVIDEDTIVSNESNQINLQENLQHQTKNSPAPTGGDLDVDKYQSRVVGEEAVGGTTPTPGQNNVDNIAASAGVEIPDFEEIDIMEKMEERDRNRWQLDPTSQNRD
ncbi:MAG: hypothetical protein F6K22_13855 [Okeania sp. SIO2F4]|uniref:DUF6335 family protein n=1 Tax=Okeania sp. SIO2F4 TaxID=2607790 RepID=UPI00142BF10D|nr:DUF6335 family protein [Okeania sp. SIO2F4]NES03828.1 hypothetical protein [Okeania sp. SIO2F4]